MKVGWMNFICGVAATIVPQISAGQSYSEMWGMNGEKWTTDSRLPDFSFAGYHCGEAPLPTITVSANVKTFGARGDGKTDDTIAFMKAIENTCTGAILIPAGHYLISDILWITKPNLVLRGEGTDKTVLHFTRELEDVRPNMGANTSGKSTSRYSWSGGFIWVKGSNRTEHIAAIISEAKRGETTVTLDNTSGLNVGQRVQVEMQDDDRKSLLAHLYSGDSGDTKKINKAVCVYMVSRVTSVDGNRISLDRPFRWNIKKNWQPTLKTFEPSVFEVGIEDLAMTFPAKAYPGHVFKERGMNGIAMNDVSDCWVRNVRISNSDSGVFIAGTFSTIDGLLLEGDRKATKGDTGHHGVTLGQDCMLQNFEFRTKFVHDITVSNLQVGNVAKNGRGSNLSFDHHKRAPYENLFCNIDVGEGAQIWRSGGGVQLGKNCGARGTFWCIRAQKDITWPPSSFGPDSMNIIGVKTSAASVTDPNGRWFEAIPPEELQPVDLHAAQLDKRLKKNHTTNM